MNVILSIICNDLNSEDLQRLTFEMKTTLDDETDLETTLVEKPNVVGSKGDAITLGQIALTALSSGTVYALFHVLKSYIERKPSIKIAFQSGDGEKLIIKAEHLSASQIDQTIKIGKKYFGDKL